MSSLHHGNRRLNQIEYDLRHLHLYSKPRCLGIVLSNACNIDCVHCYQSKNGDNLLRPPEIGADLRREFMALYPYLSTLRIQGGETFAVRGFRELIGDVAATVDRPLVSASTNGTLIGEEWAERIVRMPFSNLTISIDAAEESTFARLRAGSELRPVLENVARVRRWKEKLASELPVLDSFFVIMRSNFREIPRYLAILLEHGFEAVCLQTVEVNAENSGRRATLAAEEEIATEAEVRELHAILAETVPAFRPRFRWLAISGVRTLFERFGLDGAFLEEDKQSLYPNSDEIRTDDAAAPFELCPNAWTTLFVVENGDVHLCFLSEPVGNLYRTPVAEIWNSPKALAQRSRMVSGQYGEAGCSQLWCSWREGKRASEAHPEAARRMLSEIPDLRAGLVQLNAEPAPAIAPVRRMVAEQERQAIEWRSRCEQAEAQLAREQAEMRELCDRAQRHVDHLEGKARRALEEYATIERQFAAYRQSTLVRAAHKLGAAWKRLAGGALR